jgi:SAM-dependent methyltransferase
VEHSPTAIWRIREGKVAAIHFYLERAEALEAVGLSEQDLTPTPPVDRRQADSLRRMSIWGRVFAAIYDRALEGSEKAGLADRRQELLSQARGRVLEIGAGTGLNLPYYPAVIEEIVFAEPEEPMAKRLERKLDDGGPRGQVTRAPAEKLPFEDDSFDTVVCTLVLCTVEDPEQALSEVARVLRPGGQLLFLEHVRADDAKLARWQDRLAGIWRKIGHGCNPNRATPALIERSPLRLEEIEHGEFPKSPPIVRPLVSGRAVAA